MVSKSWTFTLNNYRFEDIVFLSEWVDVTYMIFGKEVAPTTGTPHLQGFFTLNKAVRPGYLKRVLPKGTHFEIARKCELANTRYCSKSGNATVIDRRYGRSGEPGPVTVRRVRNQTCTLLIPERPPAEKVTISSILFNRK